MLDFPALVLGPAMAVFARPVTVTPRASMPTRDPFAASGIWTKRNVDLPLANGESMNTTVITLGIRLSDWTYAPESKTAMRVPAAGPYPDEGTLWIDDIDLDGQGGATLTLKTKPPGA